MDPKIEVNVEEQIETEDEYRLAVIEIQDRYGSENGD